MNATKHLVFLAATAAMLFSFGCGDDGPSRLELAQQDLDREAEFALTTACHCYSPSDSCEVEKTPVSPCVWSAYARHEDEAIEFVNCRATASRSYSSCLLACPASVDDCYPFLAEGIGYCTQKMSMQLKNALDECL